MSRIGNKRCRVRLESPTDAPDSFGDSFERTYSEIKTVWASVVPVRARERDVGREIEADTTHRIFIRYSTEVQGINHKWRIVEINGAQRVFDIISNLGPDAKMRDIEILARVRDGN